MKNYNMHSSSDKLFSCDPSIFLNDFGGRTSCVWAMYLIHFCGVIRSFQNPHVGHVRSKPDCLFWDWHLWFVIFFVFSWKCTWLHVTCVWLDNQMVSYEALDAKNTIRADNHSQTKRNIIHFLSVPSWTRVLANEAGGVTILFKCTYNLLLLLHSLYNWRWQCVGSGHEGPHYRYLVCDQVVRCKGEVLVAMCGSSVHRCGDGSIRILAQHYI